MKKDQEFINNIPFLQGLRVLVVDNNADCCDLLELLLRFYGVETRKAFLAHEALKILVEWQPDILISEIALPEVDGFTLVQQARIITAGRKKVLSIIAITASISKKMRQFALSSGFDFWFTKPLDLNDFIKVLAYSATDRSALIHSC